ncbi:hypothetical protein TNCV_1110781 [Trichonephila clavipes]|nr:hypothetical protein TNCV_1110781 [Trichonephila clavipes]
MNFASNKRPCLGPLRLFKHRFSPDLGFPLPGTVPRGLCGRSHVGIRIVRGQAHERSSLEKYDIGTFCFNNGRRIFGMLASERFVFRPPTVPKIFKRGWNGSFWGPPYRATSSLWWLSCQRKGRFANWWTEVEEHLCYTIDGVVPYLDGASSKRHVHLYCSHCIRTLHFCWCVPISVTQSVVRTAECCARERGVQAPGEVVPRYVRNTALPET